MLSLAAARWIEPQQFYQTTHLNQSWHKYNFATPYPPPPLRSIEYIDSFPPTKEHESLLRVDPNIFANFNSNYMLKLDEGKNFSHRLVSN